jgi:hypothetical protein
MLVPLVVSFAAVLGLGSIVAVRDDPPPPPGPAATAPARTTAPPTGGAATGTGSADRPITLLVRPDRLTADHQELAPGVTVWRDGPPPGGPGSGGQVCVQAPSGWRVDGPGWSRSGPDGGPSCLSLDSLPFETIEIPVARHS